MYIDYEFDNSECHCDEDFNFPLSNIKEKNSKKW